MRFIKKDHRHKFKDLGEYQWCIICGTLRSKTKKGVMNYQKPKKLIQTNQANFIKKSEGKGVFSKACNSCQTEKPFDAFWKNSANQDGMQYECKDCCSDKYYSNERAHRVARQKIYNKKTPAENIIKGNGKPPEQKRAQGLLSAAIRWGKVIKPEECSKCGSASVLDGHHHDYSKPLDVLWLCRPCHKKVHRKMNQSHCI